MSFLNKDNFQTSNTYRNLQEAYVRESSTSAKYVMYGEHAKEEGYHQIGDIFLNSADNEKAHAETYFKLLHNGKLPSTGENLQDAFRYENQEWSSIYMNYAQEARNEGYHDIARLFESVATVERHHDARFRRLSQNIMYDKVFCKDTKTMWVCLNCGNLSYGACAPSPCPLCGYPQAYQKLNCENY